MFFLNDSKEITKKCQKKKTLTCLHGQTHIFFLYFYQRLFAFISRQKWVFVVCLIWTPSLLFFCQRFSLYSSFFLMDVWHFFCFVFPEKKKSIWRFFPLFSFFLTILLFVKKVQYTDIQQLGQCCYRFDHFSNFEMSALTSISDSFLFRENPWDCRPSLRKWGNWDYMF